MPRRNAIIVAAIGLVALLVAIVLLWSKGEAGSTREFCDTVVSGENPLDVFDRYDPTNVDTARVQLQAGVDRLRKLHQAAPGEIADDMKVLVGVAEQLVEALDPEADHTTLPDFSADFDRVSAASGTVTRFAADNCGVDLESGASDAPGGTVPAESSATPST